MRVIYWLRNEKIINLFGYEIKKVIPIKLIDSFELYSYKNADGTFDYEGYKETQIIGNKEKINNVWVIEENIRFLSNYISNLISVVKFGLCHGTRLGSTSNVLSLVQKYLITQHISRIQ